MIIFDAQELWNLQSYGDSARCVEENFCRFVDFCDHLLSVHEDAGIVTKIILSLQKVTVRHDPLEIIHVENSWAKNVAERHKNVFVDASQVILLVKIVGLNNSDARAGLFVKYWDGDSVFEVFKLQFLLVFLFSAQNWFTLFGVILDVSFNHNFSMRKCTSREP